MAEATPYYGGLVAFEGQNDIISTQLRLLPTSTQIQILPSYQSYLDSSSLDTVFDAKVFIKRVHDALAARNEIALTFLKDSTPDNKKLVFMNGGTPGAQAACINAIAEHEMDGDLARAEARFHSLVQHGLPGLEKDFFRKQINSIQQSTAEVLDEDPTIKAMRAADALDRLTANLQPSTDLDLTVCTRPRSVSLPLYNYADNFGDSAPFYVFGLKSQAQSEMDDSDQETVGTPVVASTPGLVPEDFAHPFREVDWGYDRYATLQTTETFMIPPQSPSCVGEAYEPLSALPLPSPCTHTMMETMSPRSEFSLQTSDRVIFGRASVVTMRPRLRKRSLKRTKSLDGLCTPSDGLQTRPKLRLQSLTQPNREEASQDQRRYSCIDNCSRRHSVNPYPGHRHLESHGTIGLRPERPPIILSPAPLKMKKRSKSVYVDRGTDAEEMPVPQGAFQPVLPLAEDLVIHLKDVALDVTLESVMEAFRLGTYPVIAADEMTDCPASPRSGSPMSAHPSDGAHEGPSILDTSPSRCSVVMEEPPSGACSPLSPAKTSGDADDYDPFSYQPETMKPGNPVHAVHIVQAMKAPVSPSTPTTPPTPAHTPPPPRSPTLPVDLESNAGAAMKFYDCNITDCKTAVAVQNSLRSILSIHFPQEDVGYHHFHFSLLPEMAGLWKPVFREAEPDSPRGERRRIDQILAIGSQRGIKKSYLCGIGAQLEKLGNKAGEVSRSGKLDFRYLVANAMQAFTAQPLAHQTRENPFTNAYLLATLIIPHLETYFAIHSEVRFLLLEYPPDHLPTVLALQRLVGVDLMKVAQVVDSAAKEPLPFTHVRGASISRKRSEGSSKSGSTLGKRDSHPPPASSEDVAISKANFLLTSSASDAEITTFVSTIRKLLVEVSPFYAAPPDPPRSKTSKRVPAPLNGGLSAFPRPSMSPFTPPLSPPPQSPPPPIKRSLPPRPPSPAPSHRAPSVTETVRTARSNRSRRPKSGKSEKTLGETGSLFTISFEDDSDYDIEERRLMPIFIKRPQVRKGNSRKALKFLGLA